jgi:P-type Ca2+ transporter type 2C
MDAFPEALRAAAALGVALDGGLSPAQVEQSRARDGENRLPEVEPESILSMFFESLTDKTLLILIGAALLSIGVQVLERRLNPEHAGGFLEGIAILAAVLIASLVTTINQARAQKQFRALSKEREDVQSRVLRDGKVSMISIYALVAGDVVFIETGDRIPADGILIRGVDVQLDESMLTGESMPAEKGPADLDLKGGSTVTQGSGTMLITAVGEQTEIGKLSKTLSEPQEEKTPLQERLSKLADRIGLFGLGAAILTFMALAISAFARGELPLELELSVGSRLLDFSIVAVTIVVVAVPEGLPLAVTVSLAYSVRKMARDKNLVRKLASCETMGAATVICSDKTGTLTKNRMSVVAGWAAGKAFDDVQVAKGLDRAAIEIIAEIGAINSTAQLAESADGTRFVGNPTESALLVFSEALGSDWKRIRAEARIVHQVNFTSDRKRMSTLIDKPGGKKRLLVKGAPEVMLERATAILDGGSSGSERTRPITAEEKKQVQETVAKLSSLGHRTLGLAYRDFAEGEATPASADDLEKDLVLAAVLGIDDPVRPEVKAAIDACRGAGVEVKIITGDNKLTAQTIATKIGLLGEGDLVVDGADFRGASDQQIVRDLPKLRVLARSIPSDKHRLVNLLKSAGHVVAVTGDGTNDAPALKAADVGFSMGLSGTEVAKEASDIVILDDNFASIVRAILWGRSIFENIRKFLQFQLTVNVVALTTAFLAAVFGFGIPLNAVQLLWVNLIMDTLAALALATEPPSKRLFEQPPHGRHAPLITVSMSVNIAIMGSYMVAVLFAVMSTDWFVADSVDLGIKLTFVFNVFVWMQLFNEVNARSTRFDRGVLANLFASRLFILVVGLTSIAQFAIVELGGSFFRTKPLGLELWVESVLLGSTTVVIGVIIRAVGKRVTKGAT